MDNRRIKRQFISSMQPQQLLLELLDKAELQLRRAQEAIAHSDFETANRDLLDAQELFSDLAAMMKREDDESAMAEEFFFLLQDHCLLTNLRKDPAQLAEILPLVRRLKTIYSYQLQKF